MSGRTFILGLLAFTAVFGVALWYFQTRAWYSEIDADTVLIAGTAYPVTDYRGIDAPTSPLKRRACFRLEAAIDAPPAPDPTPLVAPGWFDCFDAGALARALEAGEARAFVAERNEPQGIDRIVAVYPDGRAYEWRQLNQLYAE